MPRRSRPPIVVDLSIDFDFFIREEILWDFGHNENNPLFRVLWGHRYQSMNLWELTDPAVHADFMPAYLLGKLAQKGLDFGGTDRQVTVADSHRHALSAFRHSRGDVLVNIDAHHDCWPYRGNLACGNWLTALAMSRKRLQIQQVYPKWKDADIDGPVDGPVAKQWSARRWADWYPPKGAIVGDIFICFSGVWVPPHHFDTFCTLVQTFASVSARPLREVESFKILKDVPTREQNAEWIATFKAQMDTLTARNDQPKSKEKTA